VVGYSKVIEITNGTVGFINSGSRAAVGCTNFTDISTGCTKSINNGSGAVVLVGNISKSRMDEWYKNHLKLLKGGLNFCSLCKVHVFR
jgi:hypothetical protein